MSNEHVDTLAEFIKLVVEQQQPKRFYWAGEFGNWDDPYQNLESLMNGVVHGVSGISASPAITRIWLPQRDFLMIMDARQTIQMNDIMAVDYTDPDALVANDFAMLRRLYNETGGERGYSSLFSKIKDYIEIAAKKEPVGKFGELLGALRWDGLRKVTNALSAESASFRIGNVRQLAEYIIEKAPLTKTDLGGLVDILNKAMVEMGQTYNEEGEWMLTDNTLNIPEGSRLIVKVNQLSEPSKSAYSQKTRQKELALLYKIGEIGLEEKYRISVADGRKVHDLPYKHLARLEKAARVAQLLTTEKHFVEVHHRAIRRHSIRRSNGYQCRRI